MSNPSSYSNGKNQSELSLREYQAILATVEEVAQIGSWKLDLRTQKVTWSDEMFRLFGVEREGFDGDVNRVAAERVHPEDAAAVAESTRKVLEDATPTPISYRIVLPDGRERTVWAQGKLIRDEEGHPIALTGYVQDITERLRVEKKIIQMKRLYVTLSQVSQMIAHVKDQMELYQVMCQVAVQFGEFPLAWVGLLDDESGEVRPVAAYGDNSEHWRLPIINLRNESHDNTLTATAFRTSQVIISKDMQVDARLELLRHAISQAPYHAMAVIPFQMRGKTIGVFLLLSNEIDLFEQADEIKLLNEMRLDISFALDTMENEKERRRAEETIQLGDARYQSLVETQTDVISRSDMNGSLSFANESFCRVFGISRQDIYTLDYRETVLPEDRPILQAAIETIKQPPYHTYVEIRNITSNGIRWFGWNNSAIQDEHGHIVEFQGVGRDITERRKLDEALRRSEHILRLFVEHSPASIAMFDREMRYIVASRRYLIDYRLPQQDLTGRSHYDVFPEIPERWKEIHQRCLAGAIEKAEEDPFPREDGTLDWVRWEIRPWYEDKDVIGGVILFSEVITDRKKVQEAIHNRNQMLLTLHKVAVQVGSELRLPHLLANVLGEAQSLLNADRGGGVYLYEPDEQSLRLAHGTGINRGRDGITVQIGEGVAGHVYQTTQPLIVDDYTNWHGRATVLVNDPPSTVMGVPLFVESKVIGVLTFIANSKFRKFNALDVQQAEMFAAQVAIAIQNAQLYRKAQDEIAERDKAQEELHQLNAQLERRVIERTAELQHANRAKDEFLANMSHELRTPLNTVLGLSETLLEQRKGLLNEWQMQALGMVSSSGQHLLGLINDILEVTKIEAGKLQLFPTSVSVKELCESSLNFIKEMALKKTVHIEYINESASTVQADPQRLKQILINLLVNAVKFTPERGNVRLKVSINREKEQVLFSVADTGIGISPEDMKRLFTPFTQLDSSLSRQYEGTGLGLALVQKLTDLHGGSVEVESEPGKGSCFTIHLPWKDVEGEQNQPSARREGSLSVDMSQKTENASENGVILLAEDNAANIITLSDYLEAQGYKVEIAYDGLEAVERAKEILPDIILMDIQMPNLSGLEATALIRTDLRLAATPIIALTALAMPGDRERCLSAGADEYMSKPVSLKGLAQTIRKLIEMRKK